MHSTLIHSTIYCLYIKFILYNILLYTNIHNNKQITSVRLWIMIIGNITVNATMVNTQCIKGYKSCYLRVSTWTLNISIFIETSKYHIALIPMLCYQAILSYTLGQYLYHSNECIHTCMFIEYINYLALLTELIC